MAEQDEMDTAIQWKQRLRLNEPVCSKVKGGSMSDVRTERPVYVCELVVQDPDTGGDVPLSVYKTSGGAYLLLIRRILSKSETVFRVPLMMECVLISNRKERIHSRHFVRDCHLLTIVNPPDYRVVKSLWGATSHRGLIAHYQQDYLYRYYDALLGERSSICKISRNSVRPSGYPAPVKYFCAYLRQVSTTVERGASYNDNRRIPLGLATILRQTPKRSDTP